MKGQIYHLKDAGGPFLYCWTFWKGGLWFCPFQEFLSECVCHFRKRIPEPIFGYIIMRDLCLFTNAQTIFTGGIYPACFIISYQWTIKRLCKIIYSHSIWHFILGAEHFLGLLGWITFIICLPPQPSGKTGYEPLLFIGDADMTLPYQVLLVNRYSDVLGSLRSLQTFMSLIKIWATDSEPEIYKNIGQRSYLQIKQQQPYLIIWQQVGISHRSKMELHLPRLSGPWSTSSALQGLLNLHIRSQSCFLIEA